MNEFLQDLKWFFDFSDFTKRDIFEGIVITICLLEWVFFLFVFFS